MGDGSQKSNLTRQEQIGLKKIRKRVKDGEILVLKTDKSGKLAVIKRDNYLKMGLQKCMKDRKIDRSEHKNIERRINEHSRFWCRMLNAGSNHDHLDRIIKSKICKSENAAPMYHMVKDHKAEGGTVQLLGDVTPTR